MEEKVEDKILVSLARLSMMPTEESKNAHVYNRV
jgi:hypothetical protein